MLLHQLTDYERKDVSPAGARHQEGRPDPGRHLHPPLHPEEPGGKYRRHANAEQCGAHIERFWGSFSVSEGSYSGVLEGIRGQGGTWIGVPPDAEDDATNPTDSK